MPVHPGAADAGAGGITTMFILRFTGRYTDPVEWHLFNDAVELGLRPPWEFAK